MKSGSTTYWIDGRIPVKAIWHIDPGDASVGWPEHVRVDAVDYPAGVPHELVDSHADEIRAACLEDSREG